MPLYNNVTALPTSGRSRQVWDRQPHDTDKSWRAFCIFRDLGPDRTYNATAKEYGIRDRQGIARMAQAHDWRARVQAFDADLDQQLQDKMLAKRWKVAEQNSQIADAFLTRVVQRLRNFDVSDMSANDLATWTKLAIGIHRDIYFPRAETGVSVGVVAQIVIDPMMLPPATELPVTYIDGDDDG